MNTDSGNDGFNWGCLLVPVMVGYGLISLYAGYVGIDYHFGKGWAIATLVAAFFRFSLPVAVGAFLCAKDVWDWHWSLALLFAAPGLAFMLLMVPGALASLFQRFRQ